MPFVTEKGTKWVVTLTPKRKNTIGQRLLKSVPQPPVGLRRYCSPCYGNQACLWTCETNGGTVQQKVGVSPVIFLHLVWNSLDVDADCDHRIRHFVTFKWCRLSLFIPLFMFGLTVGYLTLKSFRVSDKLVMTIKSCESALVTIWITAGVVERSANFVLWWWIIDMHCALHDTTYGMFYQHMGWVSRKHLKKGLTRWMFCLRICCWIWAKFFTTGGKSKLLIQRDRNREKSLFLFLGSHFNEEVWLS